MRTGSEDRWRAGPRARPLARAVLASLLLSGSGCSLLFPPEVAYLSNSGVLEAAAGAAEYHVDPEQYRLVRVEVERDTVTFYYRGVARPMDEAWVLRFSRKSTEQDPTALEDVYSHLALIEELRTGFRLLEDRAEPGLAAAGGTLRYAAYAFEPPRDDPASGPLPGRGILAVLAQERGDVEVVYAMRLETRGEEKTLGRDDLEPFLAATGG